MEGRLFSSRCLSDGNLFWSRPLLSMCFPRNGWKLKFGCSVWRRCCWCASFSVFFFFLNAKYFCYKMSWVYFAVQKKCSLIFFFVACRSLLGCRIIFARCLWTLALGYALCSFCFTDDRFLHIYDVFLLEIILGVSAILWANSWIMKILLFLWRYFQIALLFLLLMLVLLGKEVNRHCHRVCHSFSFA